MTPKETPPLPATPAPTCPVCGHPVRVISADEGTAHYEPIEVAATARVLGPMSAVKVLSWLHERVAALAEAPARPPVLDAAWAEAEAALPNLWPSHRVGGGVDHWNATATADGPRKGWTGEGPTPAAALRALAARLAEPRIPQASEPRIGPGDVEHAR